MVVLIGKWAAKVAAKAASGKGEFPACLALGDLLGEEGAGRIEVGDGRGTEQGDEVVWEGAEKAFDFAAGLRSEEPGIVQPAMAQRVKLGPADFVACAGTVGVAAPGVEVGENGGDEGGGQAVAELLFIMATMMARGRAAQSGADPISRSSFTPTPTEAFAAGPRDGITSRTR